MLSTKTKENIMFLLKITGASILFTIFLCLIASIISLNYIHVKPLSLPIANFSATPTAGTSPLLVNFTDKSNGPFITSWSWNFGDNSGNAKIQNPVHKYTKVGKYNVSLKISNPVGENTKTISDYIIVGNFPVAAFSGYPKKGKAPLTVTFTDKSSVSPTSWTWSFGDGKISTVQNPKNIYSKVGNYSVTLTVTNEVGGNTTTVSNYIIVK